MTTFWLSFAGPEGFRGVAVVQVDEDDAEAARPLLRPQSAPGAEWVLAATQRAYDMGCNPGGEVRAIILPEPPQGLRLHRLLSREELAQYGETGRGR